MHPISICRARSRAAIPALGFTLSLSLLGCGGPSAEDVRARTSAILVPTITETAAVLDRIAEHEVVGMLARWLGQRLDGDVLITEAPVPATGAGESAYPEPDAMCGVEPPAERQRLAPEAARFAEELDAFLAQRVFSEANVESSSGGKTTFLIKGDVFCGADRAVRSPTPVAPSAGSGGAAKPAYDAETVVASPEAYEPVPMPTAERDSCRDLLARLELRIDASLVDDGVDLGIRVGEMDGAVVVIELRPRAVTVKGLLPALAAASEHVAAITGEPLPDGFPAVLKGVISAALKRGADGSHSAELAILEAIEVAGSVDGEAYRASLPAATPAARLTHADGELVLDASLGMTEILLPGNALLDSELRRPLDRALELFLAGFKTTIRATRAGELQIDELSIGARPSRLSFGGETVIGLDVNPDHGHALQMTLTPFADDRPRCSIDPALDVRVELHGDKLAPYLEGETPAWAADERYRLLIGAADGAAPVILPFIDSRPVATCASGGAVPPPDAGGGVPTPDDPPPDAEPSPVPEPTWPAPAPDRILKVLAGKLTLQSFVAPQLVTVGAGRCLIAEHGEDGGGPLGGLASGPCE